MHVIILPTGRLWILVAVLTRTLTKKAGFVNIPNIQGMGIRQHGPQRHTKKNLHPRLDCFHQSVNMMLLNLMLFRLYGLLRMRSSPRIHLTITNILLASRKIKIGSRKLRRILLMENLIWSD
ncbi:hypothetical protein POM88_044298 [Heracleum sosnowskyi]|uniref:Secreted protein n=1 Tax=Heracleum sosnowskyi TaxID=360622 RepID=A0AAD8M508_9APIA|nr:hypothetical protein POM88_044298 [Heracleum sosnowskyi]